MCMAAARPSTVRVMVFPRFPSPPFFYLMPTDLVGGTWGLVGRGESPILGTYFIAEGGFVVVLCTLKCAVLKQVCFQFFFVRG